jgi:extracellular matrix regulatory protein A
MKIELVNVGYNSFVSANHIIAIVDPESAPVKRLIQDAKKEGRLIQATYGRKSRSVLVMDSGQIVLSGLQPETIGKRFEE